MKAYELRPADEAAPSVAVQPAAERRFALSVRERRAVLAIADFLLGAVACFVAFVAIRHPHLRQLQFWDPFIIGGFWVVSLLIADGYAFQIPSSRAQSAAAVVKAVPAATLLSILVFFLHPYVLTRPVIVVSLIVGAAAIILFRVSAARLLLHESLATRAILLSDTEPGPEVVNALRSARFEYRVVDTLIRTDLAGAGDVAEQIRGMLEKTGAQEVIVTSNELRLVPGLVEQCLTHDVRLVTAGELVERYMGRVPLETVDVHWYLDLPERDVWRRPYAMFRRLTDLALAAILGIPFLVLLPVLALLVKLDTPGPVFIHQRRMGEGGHDFDLVKLRTMTADAEARGAQFATADDPRITRTGRVLRAVRLDEFPQLLNIVNGQMSFIGPRPERPEFASDLEAKIPHFRTRLLIRPGLTGWAQIKGGYASSVDEITRKLEYDLYYIKNRSLQLDLQILFSTFGTMVGRRGR